MNIKLDAPFENKLLGRREIRFIVEYDGPTPKRTELITELAKEAHAKPELVVLRDVKNVYGKRVIHGYIHVYDDATKMKEIEPEYILKRYSLGGESSGEEEKEGKKEG